MAPPVGQVLREARIERGIELSEVERVTKIRENFLLAIEEGRWEELPAPIYARGFLEIYARFLDLDDQALVADYRRTVEGANRTEPIPPNVIQPGQIRPRRSRRPPGMLVAGILGAVVLVLIVVAVIGALSDDGDSSDRSAASESTTTTEEAASAPATAPPTEVSLELRSTGTVWVCLVDDRDRARVKGVTLAPGERRGPFAGEAFEVTFGNGSVEMTVDGELAKVPAVAEPIGYRISSTGVRELPPPSQPTCL